MNIKLKLILKNRHSFTVAGGIALSAFTNIATQAMSYQWACPWNIAGLFGLALFVPAGWSLLNLAGHLTTWYEVHGPLENKVLKAIEDEGQTARLVWTFVCASASFVAAIALWVLFITHQKPVGAQ